MYEQVLSFNVWLTFFNFVFLFQIVPSLEYISDLLYNGFYCFELLTIRSLDSQICGICGVLGEVYLGDGNQKNCCSRSEVCTFLVF